MVLQQQVAAHARGFPKVAVALAVAEAFGDGIPVQAQLGRLRAGALLAQALQQGLLRVADCFVVLC